MRLWTAKYSQLTVTKTISLPVLRCDAANSVTVLFTSFKFSGAGSLAKNSTQFAMIHELSLITYSSLISPPNRYLLPSPRSKVDILFHGNHKKGLLRRQKNSLVAKLDLRTLNLRQGHRNIDE